MNQLAQSKDIITNPCAILWNYQNTLMHISESWANRTSLINHAIEVYELERVPLGPVGQYWLHQNPILKLIQGTTTKNQFHSSTLCK